MRATVRGRHVIVATKVRTHALTIAEARRLANQLVEAAAVAEREPPSVAEIFGEVLGTRVQ